MLTSLAAGSVVIALRDSVQALLPRVDLPNLLLEVAAWTFLDPYPGPVLGSVPSGGWHVLGEEHVTGGRSSNIP